jgi:hypothetical protein
VRRNLGYGLLPNVHNPCEICWRQTLPRTIFHRIAGDVCVFFIFVIAWVLAVCLQIDFAGLATFDPEVLSTVIQGNQRGFPQDFRNISSAETSRYFLFHSSEGPLNERGPRLN